MHEKNILQDQQFGQLATNVYDLSLRTLQVIESLYLSDIAK